MLFYIIIKEIKNEIPKKPIEIEAIQFKRKGFHLNIKEVKDFVGKKLIEIDNLSNGKIEYAIETLEGDMKVQENDWIIKGIRGEFYPCKPEIFKETYDVSDTITIQDEIKVTQKFIDETIEYYEKNAR